MAIYKILFLVFALSIPVMGLAVTARLIWCTYRCVRDSQFKFAVFSALGIAFLIGSFAAVVVVWFGYAVAHSKKDIWTDLNVMLVTGVPFYAMSFALWRLARYFQSVLDRRAAQPGAAADATGR